MLERYTYEKLHYIASTTKQFKNGTYPMDTRRRNYFCFEEGVAYPKNTSTHVVSSDVYTVKTYNTPIYEIDKNNIITWHVSWEDYDVGITRILNNGVHWSGEYHSAVQHKSKYGGVVYTRYRLVDNPKFKDTEIDEWVKPKLRKVAEMIPLQKSWKYKIVGIDSNTLLRGNSIEPVTKYDVIQRKLNAEKGSEVRKSVMKDKETYTTMLNMLEDGQGSIAKQRESFFTDLVSEILNTKNVFENVPIDTKTHPEKCKHFQKLAKEHSVVADVFVANYLCGFLNSTWKLRHFLSYNTSADKILWDNYLKHLYELNNAYDEKYHPCESKKYPSNDLIKLQKREV